MDPRIHLDTQNHSCTERRTSPVLSPSPVITPTKSKARGLLTDLAGWPSYSDKRLRGENTQPGSLTSEMPSRIAPTLGAYHKPSHLPTPQSPGNIASYLLTRTPTSSQSLQPDQESDVLPTEFQTHTSPSSPVPFRPHLIPTPDSSPLVARSRGGLSFGRTNTHDGSGSVTPSKRDGLLSIASTPPRTPSRQASTRSLTPVLQSRSVTLQSRTERSLPGSSHPVNLDLKDQATSSTSQRVKEEPGLDVHHISAQLVGINPVTIPATEMRRDYLERMAPSSDTDSGGANLASDAGGKDGLLLWASAHMDAIDNPIKGKRIALFQETSEESFEESLMAGGYGSYRSDRPLWKLDKEAEAPNPLGDTMEEEGSGSGLVSTEEEKRKQTRLAAFFQRPRLSLSVTQLLPVEVEGCGRVLMKVEPSEPQTPPKPTPKSRRSRKRKRMSADVKVEVESVAAPEVRAVDGPNWPDMEFPWRSRLATTDGLSSTEREERQRYIESFLDRESDEEVDEGHSSSGRPSPGEGPSRSPRLGGGKTFPVPSLRKHRRSSTVPVILCDPADAKSALLSKKSIRAVQLRLLRRRNADRHANNDDGELLCICRGRDDGRPLVQCDACRTWYHLRCIGIQSTSELGREEDPWFCANCAEVKTSLPVRVVEPTFVPTDVGEHGVGYEPPFLNAVHPSPAAPWRRSGRPPTTPPRMQHVSGPSWDEPVSSSTRGDPRTPQYGTASVFGDMVRVYGSTPGRLPEASLSTDESFDPTSTPSRGIMFGLPFTTPKEGRWTLGGVRSGGHDLFHTPKGGEDGTASVRTCAHHGRVGEGMEDGPSGMFRTAGGSNVTPVERNALRRMQVVESPLGTTKRSRRVHR